MNAYDARIVSISFDKEFKINNSIGIKSIQN